MAEPNPASVCCETMTYHLTTACDHHADRYSCPDALIDFVRGGFGIIVHDGSQSVVEIGFCPWCGTKLPKIADVNVA